MLPSAMAFIFDPRGDLPPSMIQPSSYAPVADGDSSLGDRNRRSRYCYDHYAEAAQVKRRPCYDWIFSSASNAHVAIDRSSFKVYTAFKSYVLTVSDQRQIAVKGIGAVELKIRRQPGTRESRTIVLENVLHVPSWLCNIISDVYFEPISDYEFTWTNFGVSFLKKEGGSLRCWGLTENFCGLDKLVLAKEHHTSRSPMLEDKDREVFSVSVAWPQGQREKWEARLVTEEEDKQRRIQQEMKLEAQRHEETVTRLMMEAKSELTDLTAACKRLDSRASLSRLSADGGRPGLSEISGNTMRRGLSHRISSLKAPTDSIAEVLEKT